MIAYQSIGNNGRLGNQLFQIASTIGIAINNEHEFRFNNAEIFKFLPKLQKYVTNDFSKFNSVYNENDFCYQDIKLQNDINLIIFGYLQSAKYFEKHKNIVLDLLEIKNDLFENYKNQYQQFNSCSIHVRRGDYIYANQANPLTPHPLATMDYYKKAIEHVNAEKYIIFSDDIEWCKNNFIGNEFSFYDSGESCKNNFQYDLFELQVMSCFNHNIIANSSYSWWAAYLNKNDNKIVTAPKTWFSDEYSKTISKQKITDSIIPKEWILI